MIRLDIEQQNAILRNQTPDKIIDWAFSLTDKRIVTTSFGLYSDVLLNTFHKRDPYIKVIWCDTGYNNHATYAHAYRLIRKYDLNIHIYVPLRTKAFTDVTHGLPHYAHPAHAEFAEIVKLEPFRRALAEHQPEVWFTNIRVRQTEFRNAKDILSYSRSGILKISPFYYWTDEDLDEYVWQQGLQKNEAYFDPVKALQSRECGIHLG